MILTAYAGPSTGLTAHAEGNVPEGYEYVTESNNYSLYMRESDLSVYVLDKQTGAGMCSAITYDDGLNNATWLGAMQSALVLTVIYNSIDTQQADLVNDSVNKTVTMTDNGFTADVYWNKYKFGMTLNVSLTDEGLVASVPEESIREDGTNYYIGTISIYPFMGNSYLDSVEGYMLVPDGNGALIYLDDKEGRFTNGYSAAIYGTDVGFDESSTEALLWSRYSMITDAEEIIAPVFGMAHVSNGIAYLGIVEDGEERCRIEVTPNGCSVNYNRCGAKFVVRRLYTQPTSNNSTSGSFKLVEENVLNSDLTVRYIFLSGDDANYAGMAVAYRDYLLNNGLLTAKEDSYHTRVDFLGTEREEWLMGTTAVTMTTTDDIRAIYADLEAEGISNLFSLYKGWQRGGLYNLPISSLNADGNIGGTKDLIALVGEAEDAGYSFYLYTNALLINPDEKNATFNTIKKVNKKKYTLSTHKDVYSEFCYLTTARSGVMLQRLASSMARKGVSSLAVAGITNTLFSYTYAGTKYTRVDAAASYLETLKSLDEDMDLVLEQPFAYLWDETDAFLDMPMYTSDYIFEDESIPFLSIVLKGIMPVYTDYVNFEANKQEFFLKMVETGAYPSFYITKESSAELINTNSSDIYSSQYSVYRQTILEYDAELSALNELLSGACITGHELLGNDVRKVTYDNGVVIYLNYGGSKQTVEGVTIESMSYKVVE